MKQLKNRGLLYLLVSVFAVVVLVGSLVWGLAGLPMSTSFSGGSKLKVVCQEESQVSVVEERVKGVLKQQNVKIESVERLTSGAEYEVVFVTRNKDVPNAVSVEVREAISDVALAEVQGFDTFGSSFQTKAWVIAVTVLCLWAAASLAVWLLSRRWEDVLAYAIGFLVCGIMSVALMIITRTEFGQESLAGVFVGLVLYSVIGGLLVHRMVTAKKQAANQDKNGQEIVSLVRKRYVVRDMLVHIVVMVLCIVAVAVGSTELMYFGAALILGLVSAVFASYYFMCEASCALNEAFEKRYNAKKEVMETVSQQKSVQKPSKTKQKRPEAAVKTAPKVAAKKRPRRKKNNQDKVVV